MNDLNGVKKYRKVDFVVIGILFLIAVLFNKYNSSYFLLIGEFIFLVSLSKLLIKKVGTVTLFSVLFALTIQEGFIFSGYFWENILVFFWFGIVFESIFYLFKKRQILGYYITAGLCSALIPMYVSVVVSSSALKNIPGIFVNILVLNLFVGFLSAFVAFEVWHVLSRKKTIIRYNLGAD